MKSFFVLVLLVVFFSSAVFGDDPCLPQPSTRTSADHPGNVGSWACRSGAKMLAVSAHNSSAPFCASFVNYWVACDLNDPNSCNDTFAANIFSNFQASLSVYSCQEYSRLWTCSDCANSYQRWLCGVLFQRCSVDFQDPCNGTCLHQSDFDEGRAVPQCVMKTCQDVCYDVVRKCPIHLGFTCPPVADKREYDSAPPCNSLDLPQPSAAARFIPSLALGSICFFLSFFLVSSTIDRIF